MPAGSETCDDQNNARKHSADQAYPSKFCHSWIPPRQRSARDFYSPNQNPQVTKHAGVGLKAWVYIFRPVTVWNRSAASIVDYAVHLTPSGYRDTSSGD